MPFPYRWPGPSPRGTALAICGVLAALLVTALAAVVPGARAFAGVTGSSPLTHAPGFRQAFGEQTLADPYGVAASPGGTLWVADTGHGRIVEFSQAGRLITSVAGGLDQPEGVATDAAGHVWVADTGHDRVVEFSPAGHVLAAFGSAGSGNGQLDQPVALALSPSGDVWVADQGNSRVEEFSASGRYLAAIRVPTPAGVALDAAGDVWVSSPSYAPGNAVDEFSPSGRSLQSFGTTQAGYGDLGDTGGIAIGPAGRVYVAQPDYGWVSVFGRDGLFYTEFGLRSDPAQASEDLTFPQGLAVTATGQVWVADSGDNRIAEFGPAAGPRASAPPSGGPPLLLIGGLAILAALLARIGLAWLFVRRRRRTATPDAGPAPPDAGPPAPDAGAPAPDAGLPPPDEPPPHAEFSRRAVLAGATILSGVAVGGTLLPLSVRRALAATLSDPPTGTLADIEHIVILMQENRSFDHYFGTMPGVRGFADPAAIRLPSGRPVFYQPRPGPGYLTPFHYDTRTTSAQATPGTDHSWPTQHQAWNNGAMDRWVAAKGPYTMGYFTQADIPFHRALAQAFTICDNYHCSVLGPTNPNRLYMWTGMIDPNGASGGPVIDNTPAYNNVILSWTTYPERLERAGISWQVYQEEDNFDDNALAWFRQFGRAPASSPLRQRGMQTRAAGWFENDARQGNLPQVSWLVAPTAQSEHPDYFPAAGAEYIASKLDAIASNPDLWRSTLFILCYDENDGLFDHVPPPTAPPGTPGEFVGAEPIGLGFRVPALVISPWSAGGYVCSDVLDHTSLIRVIEKRFGVAEPNISAFRRRTCGDFTGALRFSARPAGFPRSNRAISLATAEAGLLTAQQEVFSNPPPLVPAVNEPVPVQ
jgi:phospholipase C